MYVCMQVCMYVLCMYASIRKWQVVSASQNTHGRNPRNF